MGFIVRPGAQGRGAGRAAGDHAPHQAAPRSTRCRSRWSRWSTTSRSTSTAPAADLLAARTRCCPPAYYALVVPALAAPGLARSAPARRAELDRFGAACRTPPGAGRHGRRRCSTACCPAPPAPARRQRDPGATAPGRPRLRPRAARADPRRPAERADRPGPEPPAGQHDHRGRPAGRRHRPDRGRHRSRDLARRWAARRWPRGEVAVVTLAAGAGSRWTRARAWSRRCTRSAARRPAPHVPRGPPGQEPARRPRGRDAAAARRHHQLPHARPRSTAYLEARGQLRLPRPAATCRRGGASGCGWCRWPATCASPGRRCRSRCSTSRRRRCARACTAR